MHHQRMRCKTTLKDEITAKYGTKTHIPTKSHQIMVQKFNFGGFASYFGGACGFSAYFGAFSFVNVAMYRFSTLTQCDFID